MIGYLNKWVLNKRITNLIMLWTNSTKEAIRLGGGGAWVGVKKLMLLNNDKSSETHYRLIVVDGVYETRHVTHSIILLQCVT